LESGLFSPRSTLGRLGADFERRPPGCLNIVSPMNHADNSPDAYNLERLAEQTDGIFDMHDIEQHDVAHRRIGPAATFRHKVALFCNDVSKTRL